MVFPFGDNEAADQGQTPRNQVPQNQDPQNTVDDSVTDIVADPVTNDDPADEIEITGEGEGHLGSTDSNVADDTIVSDNRTDTSPVVSDPIDSSAGTPSGALTSSLRPVARPDRPQQQTEEKKTTK